LEKVAEGSKDIRGTAPHSSRGSIASPSSDPWDIASLSDAKKLHAIECLLTADADMRPAAFSGATQFEISQTFAPARVNLAALYAISYIYTGRYDHASAVALRGKDASYTDSKGNYVTKATAIRKAYKAYRIWFSKVRQIGLTNAKNSGLQPLEGTGLRWY
jgi:hypothetical protein